MLLDRGPVPVQVLGHDRGRPVRAGYVQVGHDERDERVAIDGVGVGKLADRQGALVGVQGTVPPRPGVSTDLAGTRRKVTSVAGLDSGNRDVGRRHVLLADVVVEQWR